VRWRKRKDLNLSTLSNKVVAAVVLGSGLAFGPAQIAHADNGLTPSVAVCTAKDTRTYTQTSAVWYASDSGTLVNKSAGTLSQSFTHSSNKSLTSTVSAEVGAKVGLVVSEVTAKLGLSVAVTASYTTSTTFTVTAPPHTTVQYRNGIMKRTFSVKRVLRYEDCSTTTKYGTAVLADSYASAS
jgi:hypothetical protein